MTTTPSTYRDLHPADVLDHRPAADQITAVLGDRRLSDAEFLRNYESLLGITYVPVSQERLAEVRDMLAEVKRNAKDEQYVAAVALADLVIDLIGEA